MLTALKEQPADKILALVQMYREDPRDTKVDLGVGVYKNAEGVTPVMRAVKAAEEKIWASQTTKAYTGLAGDPAYSEALSKLVLGGARDADRLAAIATPGGTGAVRQALELTKFSGAPATVWVSDPTWPNHLSILKHLGVPFKTYRYFDRATGVLDFGAMMADLDSVKPGDLVLLHGCCHNPSGANPSIEEWGQIADLLIAKGAIPFVDVAYQGFGDGLEEDAAGIRLLAERVPEMMIAASCSKNFGIYRERTGLLMAMTADAGSKALVQGNLNHLNRQNYSFPPDHGARIVSTILTDDALRADWASELEDVRLGMLDLRTALATELRQRTNSDTYDFVGEHRGMFSLLGVSPEQVVRMREDHAIYMVADSRINIAGLNAAKVPILAEALVATS
ncbi:MAG: amino acid aminotransferase [Pseudomonadota bacterium]